MWLDGFVNRELDEYKVFVVALGDTFGDTCLGIMRLGSPNTFVYLSEDFERIINNKDQAKYVERLYFNGDNAIGLLVNIRDERILSVNVYFTDYEYSRWAIAYVGVKEKY